ncbi:MAG: hypothetical protein ACJAZ3_002058, partial [Sphingobacteriales bacterium]
GANLTPFNPPFLIVLSLFLDFLSNYWFSRG